MGSDVSWQPFRSPEVLFENSIEVGEGLFPAVFRSIHTSRGTCSPRLHDRLPFELCLAPFEKSLGMPVRLNTNRLGNSHPAHFSLLRTQEETVNIIRLNMKLT